MVGGENVQVEKIGMEETRQKIKHTTKIREIPLEMGEVDAETEISPYVILEVAHGQREIMLEWSAEITSFVVTSKIREVEGIRNLHGLEIEFVGENDSIVLKLSEEVTRKLIEEFSKIKQEERVWTFEEFERKLNERLKKRVAR